MPGVQPRAFLSYSHSDRQQAAGIKRLLAEHDVRVEWDREFRHGEAWVPQMNDGLREADCVIVCWSKAAVKSEIIKHEYSVASYDGKFIGIALEPDIDYTGITGVPHHEAYFEWDDTNRAERLAGLLASIRRIAARRRPVVSENDILNAVRRVDRTEQAARVTDLLKSGLTPDRHSYCYLVSANSYERAEEFALRAGAELVPEHLKRLGVISDGNDEGYELEFYRLNWPAGYRGVDEALDAMLGQLADVVPGDVGGRRDLASCLGAADTVAPIVYLDVPLHEWRPDDRDVLAALLAAFESVGQDPAVRRYAILFVAAQFYEDGERQVVRKAGGIVGRLFRGSDDIDEVLAELTKAGTQSGVLPTLPKVAKHHVDAWYTETDRVMKIPEAFREDVRQQIHEPYLSRHSTEEHYLEVARCMREALRAAFLRGAGNP